MDLGPSLKAMASNDGKLKLKIPRVITNQTTIRGRLSLIGKIQGARPNINDVWRWEKFKWKLCESLDIIMLPKNYMLFAFINKKDLNMILSSSWFFGNRGLILERWRPGFDPVWAQIMRAPIWVTLSNLPFDLWHQKVFEGIGNSFRRFIIMDVVKKDRSRMLVAQFYVMVEFGVNLPNSITWEVETGDVELELRYETNNYLCPLCN